MAQRPWILLALAASAASAQDLRPSSFLRLADPPVNWRDLADDPFAVGPVVARGDGLVLVGGRERHVVHVIDARDRAAPRLACSFATPDDVEGLALDESGRLWIGGDDQAADEDGLAWADVPADPFGTCAWIVNRVAGVESGAFPRPFRDGAGRPHVAIAARFCQPDALRILDVSEPAPRQVASWSPPDPRARLDSVSVHRAADGRLLALVAASFAGVFVLDATTLPALPVLAHFDWTFAMPDADGDPTTADGCDRNGDGDLLECGEAGRAGDGRRTNACLHVEGVRVGGRDYLLTLDASLGGHLRVWSLAEVLERCPGPSACPDDVDCLPAIPNCPPTLPPRACPPWPAVDVIAPVATYQLATCRLSAWDLDVHDGVVLLAHAEAGVHVLDLEAADLPARAGASPLALTALASFDTLPGDSDTVRENYPCHPVGDSDGCESQDRDWNPSPCQPAPPPDAAFRVVVNAGQRSATDVAWSPCALYVTDQGSPDVDGLPAPSHAGAPQGLWTLGPGPGLPGDVGPTLRLRRPSGDRSGLELAFRRSALAAEHLVLRGELPRSGLRGLDPRCLGRVSVPQAVLAGEAAAAGSAWYLVIGACADARGDAGSDSFGRPRPVPAEGCP